MAVALCQSRRWPSSYSRLGQRAADEIQHSPEVAALVPQLKALVDEGAEMEVPITLQSATSCWM